MTFSQKLKRARILKDYTQAQVAELIGVARSTYNDYESGRRQPNIDRLTKIIHVLDIDANDLFKN